MKPIQAGLREHSHARQPHPAGQAAEDRALLHLQAQGMQALARNYQLAQGPGRPGGEIDLILLDKDGTVVFVEVRQRGSGRFGGAAASVGRRKQRAMTRVALTYLRRFAKCPPCRFDVVALEAGALHWHQGAFEVGPYW